MHFLRVNTNISWKRLFLILLQLVPVEKVLVGKNWGEMALFCRTGCIIFFPFCVKLVLEAFCSLQQSPFVIKFSFLGHNNIFFPNQILKQTKFRWVPSDKSREVRGALASRVCHNFFYIGIIEQLNKNRSLRLDLLKP